MEGVIVGFLHLTWEMEFTHDVVSWETSVTVLCNFINYLLGINVVVHFYVI